MPIYEYRCPECNLKFEKMRPFSQADTDAACPSCGITAKRLLSVFAFFSKGSDGSSTPIAGSGPSCSACSATSCSTCG